MLLAFAGPAHADTGSVFLPLISNTPWPAWLSRLNQFRALANLPPVKEDTVFSQGDENHAQYMVMNNIVEHSEDPSRPYYTSAGNTAAQSSNLMMDSSASVPDQYAIDLWMTGPFHALWMLDPHLANVGFGSYRDIAAPMQMAAALDVLRGRVYPLPSGASFPVMWPGDHQTEPLTSFAGFESPSPLEKCSGYTAPTGIPILLQIGDGGFTPQITQYSLFANGTPLDACEFDETKYQINTIPYSILSMHDAVVLIPKAPLTPGVTYSVSITDAEPGNQRTYSWSFTVGG